MTDAAFDARHAPGSKWLTGSRHPTLILPPEHKPSWLPSPFSLAAHMLGHAPLPEPDIAVRRGSLMEPIAYQLLEEDAGIVVSERQVWVQHPTERMGATLDGKVDENTSVEIKVIDYSDYRSKWNGRPPLYPRTQALCGMLCDARIERCLIVPLVMGHKTVSLGDIFEQPRHPDVIDALEEKGREFLALLDQGKLPPPDTSPSTIAALTKVIQLDPEAVIDLSASDEAWMRLQRWRQAKLDQQAAKQLCEADENWFRVRMLDATLATVGEFEVVAKDVKRKGYEVAPTTYRTYSIKGGAT